MFGVVVACLLGTPAALLRPQNGRKAPPKGLAAEVVAPVPPIGGRSLPWLFEQAIKRVRLKGRFVKTWAFEVETFFGFNVFRGFFSLPFLPLRELGRVQRRHVAQERREHVEGTFAPAQLLEHDHEAGPFLFETRLDVAAGLERGEGTRCAGPRRTPRPSVADFPRLPLRAHPAREGRKTRYAYCAASPHLADGDPFFPFHSVQKVDAAGADRRSWAPSGRAASSASPSSRRGRAAPTRTTAGCSCSSTTCPTTRRSSPSSPR
ncbi:hypothetical protein SO694_00058050 [Aureococcus anophagefferens]|uniref:Uncharacterized protein n=1 Tax=Aureococcus anophagefferens TaxID=44056 RepID=A0ABR1FYT9_AURAN